MFLVWQLCRLLGIQNLGRTYLSSSSRQQLSSSSLEHSRSSRRCNNLLYQE